MVALVAGGGCGLVPALQAHELAGGRSCQLQATVLLRSTPLTGAVDGRRRGDVPPDGRVVPNVEYWIEVRLRNDTPTPASCVLSFDGQPGLAELYRGDEAEPVAQSGFLLPLSQRSLGYPQPVLGFVLPPGEGTWRLRVVSSQSPTRALRSLQVGARSSVEFSHAAVSFWHLNGVYGGIILAVVLYNAFLCMILRDKLYFLYVVYAGSFGAIWMTQAGAGLRFVWPEATGWDAVVGFYLIVAAVIFGNLFTIEFLAMRAWSRWLRRLLHVSSAVAVLTPAMAAFVGWPAAQNSLAAAALLSCGVYLVSGGLAWRKGLRTAKFYCAACGLVAVGTAIYTLTFFGVLPTNSFTAYSAQLASAGEVLLLAFALGHRIRELEQERRQVELAYQQRLEREVQERTAELQQVNQRLAALSLTDGLTGLANRRHWDAHLEAEWRRGIRASLPLTVIVADVDHFKLFNDQFGHHGGDEALKRIAEILRRACQRPGDLVARYGGEEFVLLLSGARLEEGEGIAEQLRREVEELGIPHASASPHPVVTISLGVASALPRYLHDLTGLMREADQGLYVAKRAGRNRVGIGSASALLVNDTNAREEARPSPSAG
ncbi:MAG: diguanylate cyclase [Acidobacteriota bacterium]